jgi:hypothetical protein
MNRNRLLMLLIAQFIPMVLFPPSLLLNGLPVVGVVVVIFILLGWAVLRGRGWALTLCIFMQGLNVIVRSMMFFPNMVNKAGVFDITYAIVSLVAIGISVWFVFRLDRADIRSQITA